MLAQSVCVCVCVCVVPSKASTSGASPRSCSSSCRRSLWSGEMASRCSNTSYTHTHTHTQEEHFIDSLLHPGHPHPHRSKDIDEVYNDVNHRTRNLGMSVARLSRELGYFMKEKRGRCLTRVPRMCSGACEVVWNGPVNISTILPS